MRIHLYIFPRLSEPVIKRELRLPGVPRVGDIVWADTDLDKPSMEKLFVRRVEWFERYVGERPGVVVSATVATVDQ